MKLTDRFSMEAQATIAFIVAQMRKRSGKEGLPTSKRFSRTERQDCQTRA